MNSVQTGRNGDLMNVCTVRGVWMYCTWGVACTLHGAWHALYVGCDMHCTWGVDVLYMGRGMHYTLGVACTVRGVWHAS